MRLPLAHTYRHSLRARIKYPALAILTVMVLVMASVSGLLLRNSMRDTARTTCRQLAASLAEDAKVILDLSYGKRIGDSRIQGLSDAFERLMRSDSTLGLAAYSTADDTDTMQLVFSGHTDDANNPEFPSQLTPAAFREHAQNLTGAGGLPYSIVTVPVFMPAAKGHEGAAPSGRFVGAVQLAWSMAEADATAAQYRLLIFGLGILVLVAGSVAASRMAESILQPVAVLNAGMQRVTDGEFGYRIAANRQDELGQMSGRFNDMGARLAESQEQIREHARTLEVKVHERTRELKHALDELKSLDRAKDRFLSGISHEMHTPLTSIMAAVEILVDFADDDPEARREFLSIIQKEAERLTHQVGTILDLAKLEARTMSLDKDNHDLGSIIDTAVASVENQAAERDVVIRVRRPAAELPYRCDGKRIIRVLRGMLDNAVRFSPEGGRVVVFLTRREDDLLIGVADEGPGIPEDKRRKLFGSFLEVTNAREAEQGMGLGLSLCTEFARLHGGDLSYEPNQAGGSIFLLHLPMTEELGDLVPSEADAAPSPAAQPPSVAADSTLR